MPCGRGVLHPCAIPSRFVAAERGIPATRERPATDAPALSATQQPSARGEDGIMQMYVQFGQRPLNLIGLLCLLVAFLAPSPAMADVTSKSYKLKDGTTVSGEVIDEGETGYLVRTEAGETVRVAYDQIVAVADLAAGGPEADAGDDGSVLFRLLTEEELAAAQDAVGWRAAEAEQSFRISFPPFEDATLVASNCHLALINDEGTVTLWEVRPGADASWELCWHPVYGVAFWDLDGDGLRDILALAWGHPGAGGPRSGYQVASLRLNDGKGGVTPSPWGSTVPVEVTAQGLEAVREYAKEHPPGGKTASEEEAVDLPGYTSPGRYSVLVNVVVDRKFFVSARDGDMGGSDPDIVMTIRVDGRNVGHSQEASDTRAASWIAAFDWEPGQTVDLVVMDIDAIGYTTLFNVQWEKPESFPLVGNVDLVSKYGESVGTSVIEFEVESAPESASASAPK